MAATVYVNQIASPSFEINTGSLVDQRINLHTNPGMETGVSGQILRTNLETNPAFNASVANYTGNFGTGGAGSFARNAGADAFGNAGFGRATWTTSTTVAGGTGNASGSISVSTRPTVTAGNTYTASAYVRTSKAMTLFLRPETTASGAFTPVGNSVSVPANTWTRLSVTAIIPTGATDFGFSIQTNSSTPSPSFAAGDTLDIANVLIENGGTLKAYFDGSSGAYDDFVYGWSGTINASTSTAKYTSVTGYNSNNSVALQSQQWAAGGTSSLRVIPYSASTSDSFAYVYSDFSTVLSTNTTYTVNVTCRIAAPQTGGLDSRARSIIIYNSGAVVKVQAPNVAGVYNLQATFTTPATFTSTNAIRLYNGALINGGDVYYDNFSIEVGAVTDGFFSGDTPSTDELTYSWTGTANASTSKMKGFKVLNWDTATSTSTPYQQSLLGVSAGTYAARAFVKAAASNPCIVYTSYIPVVVGTSYTMSAYMTATNGLGTAVGYRFYDSAGANLAANVTWGASAVGNGTRSVTAVAPAGAVTARLYASTTNATIANVGASFTVDSAMFVANYNGNYFDGDTSPSDYNYYLWEGTPHNSASDYQQFQPPVGNTDQIYFGNKNRMQWIPAPTVAPGMTGVGWTSQQQFLNGGAAVRKSWTRHKEYNFSWTMKSGDEIRQISDYADGVYGTGPLYFLDPFNMDTNLLPQQWATPSLACYDGLPLCGYKAPTLTTTSINYFGYPSESATYTVAPSDAKQTIYIPVPPTHTLWVGVIGVDGTGGTVQATPDGGDTQDLILLGPNGPSRVNTAFAGDGTPGVTLSLGGNGTITLTAMHVQVIPLGAVPKTGNFISGQGTSGLTVADFQLSPYNSSLDRVGYSMNLVETESWA